MGTIGVTVMLVPWSLRPGVFFDTRWILLSRSGLFFGFIPTARGVDHSSIPSLSGRPGALVGTVVILVIASVGLLWKIWQENHDKPFGWLQLYVFDVVVQLVMLSCMLRMPAAMRMPTIKAVAPPILLVCLVITLVISLILKRQAARRDAEQELVVNRKALVRERGLLWRVIDPHADGPCSIASNRDPVDRRS